MPIGLLNTPLLLEYSKGYIYIYIYIYRIEKGSLPKEESTEEREGMEEKIGIFRSGDRSKYCDVKYIGKKISRDIGDWGREDPRHCPLGIRAKGRSPGKSCGRRGKRISGKMNIHSKSSSLVNLNGPFLVQGKATYTMRLNLPTQNTLNYNTTPNLHNGKLISMQKPSNSTLSHLPIEQDSQSIREIYSLNKLPIQPLVKCYSRNLIPHSTNPSNLDGTVPNGLTDADSPIIYKPYICIYIYIYI